MIVELSAKLTTLLPLLQVFVEVELTVTLPVQNNPQSLRLFLMITSVTASKTNWKKNHVNRDGGGNQHINQFFPPPPKNTSTKGQVHKLTRIWILCFPQKIFVYVWPLNVYTISWHCHCWHAHKPPGTLEACHSPHLDVGRVRGAREVGVDLLEVALCVPASAIN